LKKEKKNCPNDLKLATTQIQSRQGERRTNKQFAPRTWNLPIRQPDQCWSNDKLTALFEQRHWRRYGCISFKMGRSMGGSVATSLCYIDVSDEF